MLYIYKSATKVITTDTRIYFPDTNAQYVLVLVYAFIMLSNFVCMLFSKFDLSAIRVVEKSNNGTHVFLNIIDVLTKNLSHCKLITNDKLNTLTLTYIYHR